MVNTYILPGFVKLKIEAKTFFLDTNVWSALATSKLSQENLLVWLKAKNAIAALSIFTVIELSRVKNLHEKIDQLLTATAERIYIPLFYDELSDLEMDNYPNEIELFWKPLEDFRETQETKFLTTISEDPRFLKKRQEYLDFGYDRFMKLGDMKKNFPFEDEKGNYSSDYADKFAWATTLDFLTKYFPRYMLPFKNRLMDFDTTVLKSLYFRSKFLYYKFYVHGQSPNKSDFLDFAHISYLPYVDAFVTEQNSSNVLLHMKKNGDGLSQCDIIHINKFVEDIENTKSP